MLPLVPLSQNFFQQRERAPLESGPLAVEDDIIRDSSHGGDDWDDEVYVCELIASKCFLERLHIN